MVGPAQPEFLTPMKEAYPLAEQPHKLHPSSSRSSLFGGGKRKFESIDTLRSPVTHMGVSVRLTGFTGGMVMEEGLLLEGSSNSNTSLPFLSAGCTSIPAHKSPSALAAPTIPNLCEFSADILGDRWRTLAGLFTKHFLTDVGAERESFLSQIAGYRAKASNFITEMESVQRSHPGEWKLDVPRDRDGLIAESCRQLNTIYTLRQFRGPLPLACEKISLKFRDEPGIGVGVTRSWFTSLAEALLKNEPLPPPLPETLPLNDNIDIKTLLKNQSEQASKNIVVEQIYMLALRAVPGCADPSTAWHVAQLLFDSEPRWKNFLPLLSRPAELCSQLETRLEEYRKKGLHAGEKL